MSAQLPLKETAIYDIFFDRSKIRTYRIPVYQRNYAWDEDQIATLVKDVKDSYDNNATKPYYIGTLVTFTRDENVCEVIDGQQRLTTIFLILKAMQKICGDSLWSEAIEDRLTYSARPTSARTLRRLPEFVDEHDSQIVKGFGFAVNALREYVAPQNMRGFVDYFLRRVIIIHYNVPKDVDLNHYFEVMNSRGEQLEKHEIVKSKLYGIITDETDRRKFSGIWNACAQMSNYIQQLLDNPKIFVNNYSDFAPQNFNEIDFTTDKEESLSIYELMNRAVSPDEHDTVITTDDKFQPIIDFPNFLLIVLKLTLMRDRKPVIGQIQLDDKELLQQFAMSLAGYETQEEKAGFIKRFAFNLLRCRYLLDNYVVHHAVGTVEDAGLNPWLLERYYKAGKDVTPRRLGGNEVHPEMVNLLSMFEVSFSPKTRKNYLFYILSHLYDDVSLESYLQFLRALADKYFYDVYVCESSLNERNLPKPDIFDSLIIRDFKINTTIENQEGATAENFTNIYRLGCPNISLFVFNYTDYRLWQLYADRLRGEKLRENSPERNAFFQMLGCGDFGLEIFRRFYFSRTRKSLEHFYPQANVSTSVNPLPGLPDEKEINTFGNFAMIGADANSSGSNWDPIAKCNHYNSRKQNPVSVASLKFSIMMKICEDNAKLVGKDARKQGHEWVFSDIMAHQRKMLAILMNKE